ncbi:hypothetical protein BGZ54_003283 [Gamsiella multidivaricata]|nr:hypothetical protein BGZ54_003283 [Gamsiella multidivaricata]
MPGTTPIWPIWTHTENVNVNMELDSLRQIYDTLFDTANVANIARARELIGEHVIRRAATIRIGTASPWPDPCPSGPSGPTP